MNWTSTNYSTSVHKWLFAPHGTGMLYVRKEKIPEGVAAYGRAGANGHRHPEV